MFVSLFFPVFLGIVILCYFALPAKCRPAILFFASCVFRASLDIRSLVILFISLLFTYCGGILLEHAGKNSFRPGKIHFILAVLLSLCLLLLLVFKYTGYIFQRFFPGLTFTQTLLPYFLMPIGFSFYLFQMISYLVDVAKGKLAAEKNFIHLGCYLAFFPRLVSGPIERAGDFLPQLSALSKIKFFDRGRLSTAFTYILWGYFMKMVVADRLALLVNSLFGSMQEFDSFFLFLGMLFYTMQIYCDFAGYSNIAIGCAAIFGIRLTQNFASPYQAASISEFWRRWHISLSSFLKDYIYIPLGGSRYGTFRKCLNTMIVFLLCGMWHGSGLNFVVWGLLHGIYSVIGTFLPSGRKYRVLTFFEAAFAWIFFRAESLSQALSYIRRMLTAGLQPGSFSRSLKLLELDPAEIIVVTISILLILLIDELCYRKKLSLPLLIQEKPNAARYLIFYLLLIGIFVFGVYGPGYQAEQFIYMQF